MSNRPVFCDHLAFSFKLKELRHLPHCNNKKSPAFYAPLPIAHYQSVSDPARRDVLIQAYQDEFRACMNARLESFIVHNLGFTCSPMRGRGLHGYHDSFVLLDKSGTVECGLVGIGGNNDTVYIQISGTGCKYLTNLKAIHKYLTEYLKCYTLSRLDLAVDDFDGIFDAKYATTAFFDGAMRVSERGPYPKGDPRYICDFKTGEKYQNAMVVGSRKSSVYFRCYDKKEEQKINDDDLVWWRNEFELKKCSVDYLLDIRGAFAGINDFAASIETAPAISIKGKTKNALLTLTSRTKWVRRQCGKTLYDLMSVFEGDLNKVFGLVVKDSLSVTDLSLLNKYDSDSRPSDVNDYGTLELPYIYQKLIQTSLKL